jgi:hypothetical protein
MRPLTVVFDAPGTDLPPGVEQIPEPTYVETFIAQSAMEAFYVRVLRGLARLNMNSIDSLLDAPGEVMP